MLTDIKRRFEIYTRAHKKLGRRKFKECVERSRALNDYIVYGVQEKNIPVLFERLGRSREEAEHFMATADLFFPSKEPGGRIFLPSAIAEYVERKYKNK
jgi:hypothetical protein